MFARWQLPPPSEREITTMKDIHHNIEDVENDRSCYRCKYLVYDLDKGYCCTIRNLRGIEKIHVANDCEKHEYTGVRTY